jgi:uncharacterized RDD family membrane protein YckC
MSRPDSLGLFGVIHHDRLGKVRAELDGFVDGDAIFIEYPREDVGLGDVAALLARAPAYYVGAMPLQVLLYAPLFVVFARDLFPTEVVATGRVAEARDLPVHRVDEHPNRQVLAAGARVVVANWLAVAAVAPLGDPVAVATTAAVGLAGGLVPVFVRRRGHRYPAVVLACLALAATAAVVVAGLLSLWLLAVGLVAFFAVVFTTVEDRNDAMLDRVERLSAEHGYDDAVLVTGKGHLVGLLAMAGDRGIEVPAIHVSRWLRAGETYADVASAPLPEVGISAGSDGPVEDVVPDSESAVLGKRLLAGAFDLLLSSCLATIAMLLPFLFVADAGRVETVLLLGVSLLLGCATWFGYYVLTEARYNRTLGKARFGLAVARAGGGPPSLGSTLVRNLLRPVDVYLFGVGLLAMALDDRRRRLGDVVGGTVVGNALVREE